jgi:hypothetical protein
VEGLIVLHTGLTGGGHSSIQITLHTYSHVTPGLQQAAAVCFDEAFSTKYNEPENEAVEKFG